ncbi:hypothetical protein SEA_EMOTION_61 [Arthrobacter phage Emotion]|uniref:Uncharacterized protein n=1 Tax=Arthrobacter phage Emotion TaxID=3038361 RepID=A0AA49ER05_9CAUD|nr:hypothetical protein SEA_EMOTION_61 [Arthrobacter phage Emotion]
MNPNASYYDNDNAQEARMTAPNPFQFAILVGLNRTGKHVYAGTVPASVKARRRKAGKAAKAARKAAR